MNKKLFFVIQIIFCFFILSFVQGEILMPNKLISNLQFFNDTKNFIFEINSSDMKPDQFYKLMIHYLGSVKIFNF